MLKYVLSTHSTVAVCLHCASNDALKFERDAKMHTRVCAKLQCICIVQVTALSGLQNICTYLSCKFAHSKLFCLIRTDRRVYDLLHVY